MMAVRLSVAKACHRDFALAADEVVFKCPLPAAVSSSS